MDEIFLPGLPVDLIRAAYLDAPGNEIESGKFGSPESSAALVANTFGLFLGRAADFPPLPGGEAWGWPTLSLQLEAIVRFPWQGGRHPCLDVLIETRAALIGVESKRYEPFRPKGQSTILSDAYWRPVWGDAMIGYERVRNGLRDGSLAFTYLDAAQLVKHAFGLRTAVHQQKNLRDKQPILFYLCAEPQRWPDGRPVPIAAIEAHRAEARKFADIVAGAEVTFSLCTYGELLSQWEHEPATEIRAHAAAIRKWFAP